MRNCWENEKYINVNTMSIEQCLHSEDMTGTHKISIDGCL